VEGDAFGNVIIREADGLALGVIDVGDGRVAITAGGTINGGNIQTRVQAEPNDVRLIANGDGSDILVNQINVGDVAGVFLTADDDVVSTSENQITAENLFVRANNRSAGGTNGISLSTDVDNAILIVGDIADENQNSGDISIT